MMGLRSSTPRIVTVLGKMTGQMTTFTFVLVLTIRSFMSSLTDDALEGLTRAPDSAWITLDVALEWNMMFQGHANNAGTSGDLFKARKTLVNDIQDFAIWGKSQRDPNVTGFHRQIMDIRRSNRCVQLRDLEFMEIIDRRNFFPEDGVAVLGRCNCDPNTTIWNKLDRLYPSSLNFLDNICTIALVDMAATMPRAWMTTVFGCATGI